MRAGQAFEAFGERAGDAHPFDRRGGVVPIRRARVERQPGRLQALQLLAPVRQRCLERARGAARLLPKRQVAPGQRQRRQRGHRAIAGGVIQGRKFPQQQIERPAVADDVVQRQRQHLLGVPKLEQRGASERRGREVERRLCELGQVTLQRRFALRARHWTEVDLGEWPDGTFNEHLGRYAAGVLERAAQAIVAHDQGIERALQRRHIEPAVPPQRMRNGVRGSAFEPVDEPHALLHRGQRRAGRRTPGARGAGDGRRRRAHALTLDPQGEPGDGGCIEQGAQRQLDVQPFAQAPDQPHREQRVAAEFEEVVGHAELVELKHVAPDLPGLLLDGIARRDAGRMGGGGARSRQRPVVDLAVGQQGDGVEGDDVLRQHVGRQACAQVRAQLGHRRRCIAHHHVGHQAHVAGLVLAQRDDGARHAGVAAQHGFDLAQLDAVAAQFHLLVQPSQVLELAVMAPAPAVAGAVQACIGRAVERVGQEALRRQIGALVIAERDPAAADVDLAGGADRADATPGVEDVDLGVGDRPADHDAEFGLRDFRGARPDRRFGRAVEVPQFAAAREQLLRQVLGQALATHQRLEVAGTGPARLNQVAPGRRRRLHHVGPARFEQCAQRGAVEHLVAAGERELGADTQRQQQFEHGDVETQRRHRQQVVDGAQARLARHAGEEVHHSPMRDHHALGPAGRTRGVDHVGRVVALGVEFSVRFERIVEFGLDQRGIVIEQQRGVARPIEAAQRGRLRHQQHRLGIAQHELQALGRITRIEWDVGRTGLQDGQLRRHHVDRTFDTQADEHAASHAARAQAACQPVHAAAQRAIGHPIGPVGDRQVVGPARRLRGELQVDARWQRDAP